MRAYYENNENFREYVDRYAASRGISIEEALSHAIVRIVGEEWKKL